MLPACFSHRERQDIGYKYVTPQCLGPSIQQTCFGKGAFRPFL
jgi:hypothetical protein